MLENDKKRALNYFFELSKRTNGFNLRKSTLLNKSLVHKVNPRNVLINDIVDIETLEGEFEENLDLYYSVACPNFQCDFIFDHPLDHYSFMLMLEIAKQISIGVTHKYNDFSIDTTKNTVSNIELEIHRFAELDYPLIVGCVDKIKKSKSSMQIRELYFYFVQKEKLCAELKTAISVMSSELYNRYRINNRRNVMGIEGTNLITNVDIVNKKPLI